MYRLIEAMALVSLELESQLVVNHLVGAGI